MDDATPKNPPPAQIDGLPPINLPPELSPAFLFQVAAKIDASLAQRDKPTGPGLPLSRYIE